MIQDEIEHLFTYHTPNASSKNRLSDLREAAKIFCKIADNLVPDCADKSAGIRKLREAIMTFNAGIVLNQTKE